MSINKLFTQIYLAVLVLIFTSQISYAQKFTEYEVKLVYLYQFSRFIDWPEDTFADSSKFIIGVYGNNPFGNMPDIVLKDKLFKGSKCSVINVTTIEDALQCNMIFFSGLKNYEILKLIKSIDNAPILLVGDQIDEFCLIGGMINFTKKESKYRFEVNPDVAKNAKLTMSSKLFSVAKIINKDEDNY
jgi:hypothetical protein